MNAITNSFSISISIPILLIQWNEKESSKTYLYFRTRTEVIEHVLKMYEEFLDSLSKMGRGKVRIIELTEVLSFVYSLYDFAYLELESKSKVYKSHGKDWFSEILKEYLNANVN